MQTTALLSELIVIGTTSLSWFIPIINEIFFSRRLIEILNNEKTIYIIVFLSLIYFLGILVNHTSDILFHYFDTKLSLKYGGKENIQHLRIKIIAKSKEGASYIFKKRSLIRILRSSAFNILILFIYVLFNFNGLSYYIKINKCIFIIFLILLLLMIFYFYIRSLKGYLKIVISLGENI